MRLIGGQGEQLGIMSADEALKIAEEQGFDLVKNFSDGGTARLQTAGLWKVPF